MTDATMLERAARAARDDAAIYGADLTVDQAAHVARAVLMAVRDLDDETRQRGSEIYCTKGSGLFTAMIDAILADGEGR
ncbi:hypothetical protein [Brevundimonas sp. CEF1]|uniref:hypothetical protein n=1 Tax=Brevundimonas sp. CEF1 TaxID=3442642 RepID=UPI003F51903D